MLSQRYLGIMHFLGQGCKKDNQLLELGLTKLSTQVILTPKGTLRLCREFQLNIFIAPSCVGKLSPIKLSPLLRLIDLTKLRDRPSGEVPTK